MNTALRHSNFPDPRIQCPLCVQRVRDGEQEAGRLLAAGAPWAEGMRSSHVPRRATLGEHKAAMAIGGFDEPTDAERAWWDGHRAGWAAGSDWLIRLSRRDDLDQSESKSTSCGSSASKRWCR